MDYITVNEAADKWGVSSRSITYHLAAGRIEGAIKMGHMWLIPAASPKPPDNRKKKATSFHALLDQQTSLFSVLDLIPFPLEVFAPDGICAYLNKAFVHYYCISDPSDFVGRLNVLHDPDINEKLGLTDYLRRVFSGEILTVYGVKAPFEKKDTRGRSRRGTPREREVHQDITCFPLLHEDGSTAFVIAVFKAKHNYQSRLDAVKAKEYIDAHWLEDFNLDIISTHTGLSRRHLTRVFKSFVGTTPYNYYQEVKVEKIKQALRNLTLTISEAFASCGADYSGAIAGTFKRKTGMMPSEYRRALQDDVVSDRRKQATDNNLLPTAPLIPVRHSDEELFQAIQLFPIPVQVFKRNGDIVFVNDAVLRMWNVKDTSRIIGNYNVISDPLANGQPKLKEGLRRVFQGEVVLIPDVRIPLEDFWRRYEMRSTICDLEAIYTDILNFPVAGADGHMAYMVAMFFTSRIYQGRAEVAKAREYLENNWRAKFDISMIAEASCLSTSHLTRLFKRHTGMTPYSYYRKIKINRLKDALRDKNLSVTQAFISCGFEYLGNFTRFFKEQVGVTPSQYRKMMD